MSLSSMQSIIVQETMKRAVTCSNPDNSDVASIVESASASLGIVDKSVVLGATHSAIIRLDKTLKQMNAPSRLSTMESLLWLEEQK